MPMPLDQVPAPAQVLVDANVLVYHFQPHPGFGPMCHRFMERIERQDIKAITFTNLLGEVAHRLMLIEAATLSGWAGGKVLNRLKQQPSAIQQLTLFQTAVDAVLQSRIGVFPVPAALLSTAAALSRQHNLLTNDALIVALMQRHGLTLLASADADLDRVPGLTRYAPA
jgi:predicted nucleic acid-binding protein